MSEHKEPDFKPVAPTPQHRAPEPNGHSSVTPEHHLGAPMPTPMAGIDPNSQTTQSSVMAVLALVLGIVSLPLSIFALPALIVSIIAMKQTGNNKQGGRGMAIAGLVMSIISMIFFFLFVVLFVVGMVASKTADRNYNSYTSPTTFTKTTLTGTVGKVVSADKYDITVTEVQKNFKSADPSDKYTIPATGKEHVLVTVKLKNKDTYTSYFSAYNFTLRDSTGLENSYVYMGGTKQFLYTGTPVNSETTGQVVFEVPTSDSSLTLTYTPSSLSSQKTEIKL